jgi:hypothetical protein
MLSFDLAMLSAAAEGHTQAAILCMLWHVACYESVQGALRVPEHAVLSGEMYEQCLGCYSRLVKQCYSQYMVEQNSSDVRARERRLSAYSGGAAANPFMPRITAYNAYVAGQAMIVAAGDGHEKIVRLCISWGASGSAINLATVEARANGYDNIVTLCMDASTSIRADAGVEWSRVSTAIRKASQRDADTQGSATTYEPPAAHNGSYVSMDAMQALVMDL